MATKYKMRSAVGNSGGIQRSEHSWPLWQEQEQRNEVQCALQLSPGVRWARREWSAQTGRSPSLAIVCSLWQLFVAISNAGKEFCVF